MRDRISRRGAALGAALAVFSLTACAGTAEPAPRAPAPAATASAEGDPVLASWPPPRPIPERLVYPADFQQAIQRGTRTADGRPGPNYWQQWSEYDMDARVDPAAKRVEGTMRITYHNRAPQALPVVFLELTQNYHAEGAMRLEQAEVTGGTELTRVVAGGQTLSESDNLQQPAYAIDGTRMAIRLPQPIPTGGSGEIEIDFGYDIPQAGASGRMGHQGENLVFLAYWHPRMAVLDDVVGWQIDPFLGAEFYHGFGDYEYSIEAPAGWLVLGTGALTNRDEVLAPAVLERLNRAERSDEVVQILAAGQEHMVTRARSGNVVWRFDADSVRDIAVSITRESRWDAARTPVGDLDGDGDADYARVDAIWRGTAPRWQHAARYAQHSIDFLSRYTATPYPWPHMTVVEGGGIIGGGMEYPMMTLIGDYNQAGDSALYNVVAHELAHMWVPMIASIDERRYSWLDEGTTSFNENMARKEFFPGAPSWEGDQRQYLQIAGTPMEGEIMRRSDYHYPGPAFGIASYPKPASLLVALRGLLGEETFDRAYHAFFDRWAWLHPYPYDFWNTFEDVSGRDLDWFWTSWYYTTWTMDQAVASVEPTAGGGARIVVEDLGNAPMPARMRITRADGSTLEREVPVETWLRGATRATVTVPAGPAVTRVQLDPEGVFPDADRENDVWVSGTS